MKEVVGVEKKAGRPYNNIVALGRCPSQVVDVEFRRIIAPLNLS